jgi:5-methylcytosine-specific restriction endonuclease McrA
MDHIVPISKGGTHTLDNVQMAHRFCNLSKGNRSINHAKTHDWCRPRQAS